MCSLPTGMRSQWISPISTTASTSKVHNSPTRMPVRARSSTDRRRSGRVSARAARMNRAKVGSSKNLGSGSSLLGMSPAKIGDRGGASVQPHSMMRSKNIRTVDNEAQMVLTDADRPWRPGLAASQIL